MSIKLFSKVNFVKSFLSSEKMPFSTGEIAFFGRSNSGKSTLLNLITGRKISLTSKKPGKTVTINFFSLAKNERFIVDLPGYGFAFANKELKEHWANEIIRYLANRKPLKMVFVLIDSKVGITQLDLETIDTLSFYRVPFSLIFNKIDKLGKLQLKQLSEKNKKLKQDLSKLTRQEINVYEISGKKRSLGDMKELMKKVIYLLTE